MRGSPNFAERTERACARLSSSTLDKIGSPAPRSAAPAASLTQPDRHGAHVPSSQQKEGTMITLYDHIQELRAELRGCFMTRRERAATQAELARAIAAQAEIDRAFEARFETGGR
jgi:hypothetical protein